MSWSSTQVGVIAGTREQEKSLPPQIWCNVLVNVSSRQIKGFSKTTTRILNDFVRRYRLEFIINMSIRSLWSWKSLSSGLNIIKEKVKSCDVIMRCEYRKYGETNWSLRFCWKWQCNRFPSTLLEQGFISEASRTVFQSICNIFFWKLSTNRSQLHLNKHCTAPRNYKKGRWNIGKVFSTF